MLGMNGAGGNRLHLERKTTSRIQWISKAIISWPLHLFGCPVQEECLCVPVLGCFQGDVGSATAACHSSRSERTVLENVVITPNIAAVCQ
jgi:hypothetical protein